MTEHGRKDPEGVEVDDVEVGPLALGHRPAVAEAVEVGVGATQLVDEQLDRESLSHGPVTGPVGQMEGRRRAVGDQVHVGPGIAQTRHRVGVEQHLATDVERPVDEVRAEQCVERRAVLLEKQVVHVVDRVEPPSSRRGPYRVVETRARSRPGPAAGR